MTQLVAYEAVKHAAYERIIGGKKGRRVNFFNPVEGKGPQGMLLESPPHRVLQAHWHTIDQFQMFVSGSGTVGRHPVTPYAVHFSRAYTPYGPIINGPDGIGWLTLRPQPDPGAQYMPEKSEVLRQVPNRHPWQITSAPDLSLLKPDANGVAWAPLAGMHDDQGLLGSYVSLRPHATTVAPSPANTGGQYIVVTSGSILHEGETLQAMVIGYLLPGDSPLTMTAGNEGMEAMVLSFPRTGAAPARVDDTAGHRRSQSALKTWSCPECGFVYDEAEGLPLDGIAAGTRWTDVPADFMCPDCNARKADFEAVEF